ncbi:Endoribonuclease L-PSP/chorismate mutase-like protein [Paramyrothecium foliicola]|nr:Endoribonuclease L-PSP/chorismate mutase-like protein [Paramyrothecium foliicola]
MAPQIAVHTTKAPAPLPQFSQAVKYNGLLFCSGSVGMDPATNTLVEGTVKDRARQALSNLQNVIEAGGSSLEKVLKANIFLTDMANFATVNEAWDEFFTQEPKPVSGLGSRGIGLGSGCIAELFRAADEDLRCSLSTPPWNGCRD